MKMFAVGSVCVVMPLFLECVSLCGQLPAEGVCCLGWHLYTHVHSTYFPQKTFEPLKSLPVGNKEHSYFLSLATVVSELKHWLLGCTIRSKCFTQLQNDLTAL